MQKYQLKPCPKCSCNISSNAFNRHINACTGEGKKSDLTKQERATKYERNETGQARCPTCGQWFSMRGIAAHIRNAHGTGQGFSMKGRPSWNKGKTKATDERIAKASLKISETLKENPPIRAQWTDEMKKLQSELKKKLYREYPEKHPNRKLAGNRAKMSYPERIAFDWLTKYAINFEHQFAFENWFVDFRVGTILIEIDGMYWHDAEKDTLKDEVFKTAGFEIYRIKASEHIESRLAAIFGRSDTIRTCDIKVPNFAV